LSDADFELTHKAVAVAYC